jgi:ribosomal protein L37AE/L43A
MDSYNLIYNCPGCGKQSPAPEAALTAKCEYCGLVVRIGALHRVLKYFYPSRLDDYGARMAADRYLKAKGLSLTGDVLKVQYFYLPFYRFRGIALDYIVPPVKINPLADLVEQLPEKKPKLKAKDFDVTIPAFDSAPFGMVSLGIRPQVTAMYAFSYAEVAAQIKIVGSTITPTIAEEQALKMRDNNTLLYDKTEATISAMIGEKLSMIYFPVCALTHEVSGDKKTVFVDALAKRAYAQIDGEFDYSGKLSQGEHSHYIKPVRHQCPNCGADLIEDHFSLFYPCRNCGRSYLLTDDGYTEINPQSAQSSLCAPYWRFPLEFTGRKSYKTVSDYSKILGGEIALLRKEKRQNQFYLYSPAFKSADIHSWFDAAYAVLRTQPHDSLADSLPQQSPAFCIDEVEARQMAIFLWRMLTLKYAWKLGKKLAIDESSLPAGRIVWLPAGSLKSSAKALNFKEVNVVNQ